MASSSLAAAVALLTNKTQQVLDASLAIAAKAVTQDDLASVAGLAGQASQAVAGAAKKFELAAPEGAASIGTTEGTVQAALLARLKSSEVAAVNFAERINLTQPGGVPENVYINLIQKRRLPASLVGAPNATSVAQAMINAMPDGCELDGLGGTYNVTSLNLKSNMRMIDVFLRTVAGAEDLASPITVNGAGGSPKSNIELRNVRVDGNRANQSAVDSSGQGEDGGRHGFRIVGRVSDLRMYEPWAVNCASDGFEFYRFFTSTVDSTQAFSNILIENPRATGNRRHGMSVDSINGLTIINPYFTGNGLDLNTSDPLSSGTRGARLNGSLYGNSIDFEGYGTGSRLTNIFIDNPTFLGNAESGLKFYDPVDPSSPNFLPRSGIRIRGGVMDAGVAGTSGGAALQFTSSISKKSLGAVYRNVMIEGVEVRGYVLLRAVDKVSLEGGTVDASGTSYALLDFATNVTLNTNPIGPTKKIEAYDSTYKELRKVAAVAPAGPTLSFNGGTTGTLSSVTSTLVEDKGNGHFVFLVTAQWTASAASGNTKLNLTPDGTSLVAAPAYSSMQNNVNGALVLIAHNFANSYLIFSNTTTQAHSIQVTVDVKV